MKIGIFSALLLVSALLNGCASTNSPQKQVPASNAPSRQASFGQMTRGGEWLAEPVYIQCGARWSITSAREYIEALPADITDRFAVAEVCGAIRKAARRVASKPKPAPDLGASYETSFSQMAASAQASRTIKNVVATVRGYEIVVDIVDMDKLLQFANS